MRVPLLAVLFVSLAVLSLVPMSAPRFPVEMSPQVRPAG